MNDSNNIQCQRLVDDSESGDVWIAGVDGCKAGWFRVSLNLSSGDVRFDVVNKASDLVRLDPRSSIVAIDVPIGLPDSGARECDLDARRKLGIRRNSVFPSPIRPAIEASSYDDACSRTEMVDGRRVSQQAWAIFPKIKEVDDLLQERVELRSVFYEVHPEMSFWAWNSSKPMAYAKKKVEGGLERKQLIEAWLGADICTKARGSYLKRELADDDISDAFAALWTAKRIYEGNSLTLPPVPSADSAGLPVAIHY